MNLIFFFWGQRPLWEYSVDGVTLNLFAIKSPWNKYALMNMPSKKMLAEKCPAEKTPSLVIIK